MSSPKSTSQPQGTVSKPSPYLGTKAWRNPNGWGARHINDHAPFSLWNPISRSYRMPTHGEYRWFKKAVGDGHLNFYAWFLWVETSNPPQPVPLTLGCIPVMFSIFQEVGTMRHKSPYAYLRFPDPCPDIKWPRMSFPSKEQNVQILKALQPLADVWIITYLPQEIIVELVNDGRNYEFKSLPAFIAGYPTSYYCHNNPLYLGTTKMSLSPITFPTAEVDTALQKLTLDSLSEDTKVSRREVQTSSKLLRGSQIEQGAWFEIEVAGSCLISLMIYGLAYKRPKRAYGQCEVDFNEWDAWAMSGKFGAVKSVKSEGVRGAPFVQCETGALAGFVDFYDGRDCLTNHIDDLVEEDWEVVQASE